MHGKHVIIFLILLAGCTTEGAPIPAANINVRVQDDTPIVLPPVPRPVSLPFDGIPPIYKQGCSVLKNTGVIEDVIKVHTIVVQFQADILNIVPAEDIQGKTSQLRKNVRIGSNARLIFAKGYIADMVIAILGTPMITDGLTEL